MMVLKLQASVNTTSNASKFSITEINKTNGIPNFTRNEQWMAAL
jgi:hypothetical protein